MPKRKRPVPPPYADVEDLLYEYAHRWAYLRRHDVDDLFSIANEVYLDVAATWDGAYPFEKTLRYYLWAAFSMRMRDVRRRRRLARIDMNADPDAVPVERSDFRLSHFAEGLPDDAVAVVKLVFDTPPDFLACLRKSGWGPSGDPGGRNKTGGNPYRGYKTGISRYLTTRKRWTERRVAASFKAIAEGLA